jgi:MFS family permease
MKISSTNQKLSLAYLNTLTFSCVQILLYTTIPYISEVTALQTATIIGSISVGSFIFAGMGPYWSGKSDTMGRKKVLSLGMFGMGFSFLLLSALFIFNRELSLNVKIIFIYISRIIYGLLASAIVPVSQAWQLDLIEGKDKLKILTRNSMCLNVGRVLGPIFVLIKKVDFEHIIYAGTIWVFFLALGSWFTTETTLKTETSANQKSILRLHWRELLKEAMLPLSLALIFTSFIGVLHSTLGHHLKETFNIRGDEASVIMAKIVLASSLFAIVIQQFSQWIFKQEWKLRLIVGSSCLILGSFMLNKALSMPLIWSALGFISIGLALIPPVYLALISHSSVEGNVHGVKIGFSSIAHSLGYALGAGMVALSMKMNLVSNMTVIVSISVLTFFVVTSLIFNRTDFILPAKKRVAYE